MGLSSLKELYFRPVMRKKAYQLSVHQNPTLPIRHKKEDRECFYCYKCGHLISNCLSLKRKQQSVSNILQPKGVSLITAEPHISATPPNEMPDSSFQPFIFEGIISLTGEPDDKHSVRILRDTGGSQTIMLADALPFSESCYCFSVVLCGDGLCSSPGTSRLH